MQLPSFSYCHPREGGDLVTIIIESTQDNSACSYIVYGVWIPVFTGMTENMIDLTEMFWGGVKSRGEGQGTRNGGARKHINCNDKTMSIEEPYRPSEKEMEKAEEQQSVRQRVMSELREVDALEAEKSGVEKDALRKIFVTDFEDSKREKTAVFKLDEKRIVVKRFENEDPQYGKYIVRIGGVRLEDQDLSKQMFDKYFPAAKLVANDQMRGKGLTDKDYEHLREEKIGHFYDGARIKIEETPWGPERKYVEQEFLHGHEPSYDVRAGDIIDASPELKAEVEYEIEANKSFASKEAERKRAETEAQEKALKEKRHQSAINIAKELLG